MIRATLASAAACLVISAPAAAAGDFAFKYSFDREAVQTEAGARAIYQELFSQVARRCDMRGQTQRLADIISESSCQKRTLDSAVSQIDSPALDRIHAEKTDRR